jgi:hypothetical protein
VSAIKQPGADISFGLSERRRDSLKWPQEDGSNWLHRVAAERGCDGLIWPHLRDTPWRLWRLELAPLHGERRPDGPDLLITKVEA